MTRHVGSRNKNQMDMTSGPLFPKIVQFILPLIATNLLQQFYHAADIIIVGLSPELDAVGAVGSTNTFLNLIVNLFIGFSVGANVTVAHSIGSQDKEKVTRATHTSICMSLLFGVIGAVLGIVFARPVLVGMGYEGNLLVLALRYSYIYLACLPFLALTNFLSAILQAQGNTKTSLFVLSATGILNIALNLFFVLVLGLSVEGVALATAVANLVSACILWFYLYKQGGDCQLSFRKLRMYREQFIEIARIGFPSGAQAALFSISNLIIQSSILQVNNALTPVGSAYAPIVKGNSSVGSLESFIFNALGATTVTACAFTAQNAGAKAFRRVRRAFGYICLISVVVAVVMPIGGILLRNPLLSLYGIENSEDVLATLAYGAALERIVWKWPFFFIYAIMNACAGSIRGLGKSSTAALITFFGTCVFRIVWIYTVFRHFQTLRSIHISYPISWFITGAFFFFVLFRLLKKQTSAASKEV